MDFVEQQLHADSFRTSSYILSVFLSQQTLNVSMVLGRNGEGHVVMDEDLALSSGRSKAAVDRPWGHVNTVTVIFFPSHVIC